MLTAPGQMFEIEEVEIVGRPVLAWKNLPATNAELMSYARGFGARDLVVLDDERVTYEAFHRAAAAFAGKLAELGVGRGDRVAIAMRNLPEFPVAFIAATLLGAIAVPRNAWWRENELAYAMRDSGGSRRIAPRCPISSTSWSRAETAATCASRR